MTIIRAIVISASLFIAAIMAQNVIAGIVAVQTGTTSHGEGDHNG